jgi:hypothetical protein
VRGACELTAAQVSNDDLRWAEFTTFATQKGRVTMRYARSWFTTGLACTLSMAIWGCGDNPPSVDTTTAEAKVSGTIRVRGKPMPGGQIAFDPTNYKRTGESIRRTNINPDGTYSVTTLQGHNSARITGPMVAKEPQLGYGIHTIEVAPGDNQFDIDLPPK